MVYHWGRIIGALVLILATVALAAWGITAWNVDDSAELAATESDNRDSVRGEGAGQLSPPENILVEGQSLLPTESEPVVAPKEKGVDNFASAEEAYRLDSQAEIVEAPVPDLATEEPTEVTEIALTEARIHSGHLARVQLTSGLENKEPVDQLPVVIEMNEKGLLRVYLYTETRDLEGQVIYHDWIREGLRVARIAVRPYSDHMRASSSKFIDRHMLGQWLVTVTDANGDRLASVDFEIVSKERTTH